MKKSCLAIFIALFTITSTFLAFASDSQDIRTEQTASYIYEILNSYESGTFVERNDLPSVDTRLLLPSTQNTNELDIVELYDNRKIGSNEFAATRVSIVKDLEKTDQGSSEGIVAFVTIVYNNLDMGDAFSYPMLTKVKGGIVRQDGTISASSLSFAYNVGGDAFTPSGEHRGIQGSVVKFNGELENPQIGATYFINGPSDYHYCMGSIGSHVAGFMRVTLSNGKTFQVTTGMEAI